MNLPFPFRTPDKVYLKAFDQIVIPITQQYKPELVLVSVGFDGYYADPVGALSLSVHIYAKDFLQNFELGISILQWKTRGNFGGRIPS